MSSCQSVRGCEELLAQRDISANVGFSCHWSLTPFFCPGAGLSFGEMVAELRARARKGPGHSSAFRGVSLLRATGRWHAQINAAGKQVGRRPAALAGAAETERKGVVHQSLWPLSAAPGVNRPRHLSRNYRHPTEWQPVILCRGNSPGSIDETPRGLPAARLPAGAPGLLRDGGGGGARIRPRRARQGGAVGRRLRRADQL